MWPAWANTEAKTPLKCFTFSFAIFKFSFQISIKCDVKDFMIAIVIPEAIWCLP
jgi:hypothetical protein